MSEQNNEQRSQAAGTDTVDRGNSNAKLEQLEAYREDATGEALSTNTGTRIADNQNTLKAGERGPSPCPQRFRSTGHRPDRTCPRRLGRSPRSMQSVSAGYLGYSRDAGFACLLARRS